MRLEVPALPYTVLLYRLGSEPLHMVRQTCIVSHPSLGAKFVWDLRGSSTEEIPMSQRYLLAKDFDSFSSSIEFCNWYADEKAATITGSDSRYFLSSVTNGLLEPIWDEAGFHDLSNIEALRCLGKTTVSKLLIETKMLNDPFNYAQNLVINDLCLLEGMKNDSIREKRRCQ